MSTDVPSFTLDVLGRHVRKDHQRVVHVAPGGAAQGIVHNNVVVDEQRVEPQLLRFARRFDDGFGSGREPQVVRVWKPERVLDHALSVRMVLIDSRLRGNDGLVLGPSSPIDRHANARVDAGNNSSGSTFSGITLCSTLNPMNVSSVFRELSNP